MDDIIQLTIGENQININELSVTKVMDILGSYIQLLACQAKFDNLGFTPNKNNISFKKLDEGCLLVELTSTVPQYAQALSISGRNLADTLSHAVNGSTPAYLKEKVKEVQKSLQLEDTPLILQLFGNESKVARISPSDIQGTYTAYFDEEITIYGRLLHVGGKDPNFHIESDFGKTYIIRGINEETARSMADYLYKTIGIKAIVRTSVPDLNQSTKGTFVRLLSYSEDNREERVKELREYFSGIVGENRDIIEELMASRGE